MGTEMPARCTVLRSRKLSRLFLWLPSSSRPRADRNATRLAIEHIEGIELTFESDELDRLELHMAGHLAGCFYSILLQETRVYK